ncbi:MAG: protein-L-isoaspartate(D-aspartate) O-methyltransferase [Deltaproteobacteria bacterium]|nr:protein-L-isoaspartate(D-aspartate) O-methyltransferase [Deltaproteobacteria bacterium]
MFKITYFSFILLLIFFTISIGASRKDLFTDLRERMVTTQIIARGIKDPKVIEAMRKVPRHLFVPENIRGRAYDDRPLPIGEGQTISQPYIVAFMTEALNLSSGDKALEIGTGSGYQAAILAEIVKEVYTIEIRPRLGETARERLKEMGYKNIFVEIGDGYKGWPEKAPFNAIIVTCAPEKIPRPLIDQLAEGGRMIIPVGEEGSIQELVLMKKEKGMIIREEVMKVLFVPMITEEELKAR